MTSTEILARAMQAVQNNTITWNDYESLVVSLNTHPPHDRNAPQLKLYRRRSREQKRNL